MPPQTVPRRTAGRPVRLGVLVGSRLREVRSALDDEGVAVEVRRRVLCAPGVVLRQHPAPGTRVDRGAIVRLLVAQAPAAATCAVPSAARAVLGLRAWALGDEPPPAFADRVRILVADRPFRTLSAEAASRPGGVDARHGYAERSEVDVLGVLSGTPTREAHVPPYACLARGRSLPADLVRRLPGSWSLATRGARACLELAAVQVWADGEGRITDVNVLMGSP